MNKLSENMDVYVPTSIVQHLMLAPQKPNQPKSTQHILHIPAADRIIRGFIRFFHFFLAQQFPFVHNNILLFAREISIAARELYILPRQLPPPHVTYAYATNSVSVAAIISLAKWKFVSFGLFTNRKKMRWMLFFMCTSLCLIFN